MKNRQILRRLRAFLADQDGAIAIVIALLLPVLLGFAGLAVDIGHMYAVDAQLKNAADAGALRGAKVLVPYTGSPGTPNWAEAMIKAPQAVNLNSADGKPLTQSTVTYGYWSFLTTPPSLKPAGTNPDPNNEFPAVSVTVSKTAGKNDGPVKMFLASVLGVISADRSATSVAMISFPTKMLKGGLKPLVATTDILAKYWEKFNPQNPLEPMRFQIGDPQQKNSSVNDTMWTSFQPDINSDAYTKELIHGMIPGEVGVGEMIHLQPGARADDYGIKEMGFYNNQTVVIPIVTPETLIKNCEAPVEGFVAFHITDYNQGAKYIEGYFDEDYSITLPQKKSGNPPSKYSTAGPPQLVN